MKNIVFVIILVGAGIFNYLNIKADNEYNFLALAMSAPFLLAGFFLLYIDLPSTNIIKQFANRIHLGSIIFVGVFFSASIFLSKRITNGERIDWIVVVIFLTLLLVIGQFFYKKIVKK